VNESDESTEHLLKRVQTGDQAAWQELLTRHRRRLRNMVAIRLDRRLLSRFDPSDVVQEAMMEAHQKLEDYLREKPMALYPWLREIALQRLARLQRRHLHAGKRSVTCEEPILMAPTEDSVMKLADRLASRGSSPSEHMVREEVRRQVRVALANLSWSDRELLVLRYLEQMPMKEIACVLQTTEGAVKTRHVRALERLHDRLNQQGQGDAT
jgi:RNA polymerase sigma-70 factor (ECF subfamily)